MRQKSRIIMPNLQRMRTFLALMLVAGLGLGGLLLLLTPYALRHAGSGGSLGNTTFAILLVSATPLALAVGSAALLVMVKRLIRWQEMNVEKHSKPPGPSTPKLVDDWEATRQALESQIQEAKRVEEELRSVNQELQNRVATISRSNEFLQNDL